MGSAALCVRAVFGEARAQQSRAEFLPSAVQPFASGPALCASNRFNFQDDDTCTDACTFGHLDACVHLHRRMQLPKCQCLQRSLTLAASAAHAASAPAVLAMLAALALCCSRLLFFVQT